MNIFILDKDAVLAAQMQCDKHVVKMIVESAQMLSTAHRLLDESTDQTLYKVAHKSHPCTLWTMRSNNNYNWHYIHFGALCREYTHRYGKIHKSEERLLSRLSVPPVNIPVGHFTPQPLAMKSNPECMDPNDVVGSYRKFYMTKLARMPMVWTNREVPEWFR
jgi:hypothetical protein